MTDDEVFRVLREAYLERVAQEKQEEAERVKRYLGVSWLTDFAKWEQEMEGR